MKRHLFYLYSAFALIFFGGASPTNSSEENLKELPHESEVVDSFERAFKQVTGKKKKDVKAFDEAVKDIGPSTKAQAQKVKEDVKKSRKLGVKPKPYLEKEPPKAKVTTEKSSLKVTAPSITSPSTVKEKLEPVDPESVPREMVFDRGIASEGSAKPSGSIMEEYNPGEYPLEMKFDAKKAKPSPTPKPKSKSGKAN